MPAAVRASVALFRSWYRGNAILGEGVLSPETNLVRLNDKLREPQLHRV